MMRHPGSTERGQTHRGLETFGAVRDANRVSHNQHAHAAFRQRVVGKNPRERDEDKAFGYTCSSSSQKGECATLV